MLIFGSTITSEIRASGLHTFYNLGVPAPNFLTDAFGAAGSELLFMVFRLLKYETVLSNNFEYRFMCV